MSQLQQLTTLEDLQAFTNQHPVAVIKFSAGWCAPCKTMESIIDAVAVERTDLAFAEVDVDQASDLARQLEVQSVPTMIVLQGWVSADERLIGAKNKAQLLAWLPAPVAA